MHSGDTNFSGGSNRGRRVCIIGAGIGGLTAALAFAQRGAIVRVLEAAPQIAEVGAGIQITPNGACVLDALGLGPQAGQFGLAARAVVPMDALSGARVTRFDLSTQTPPYRFYHRADLIGLLERACRDCGVTFNLGTQVLGIDGNGAVQTSDGAFECDLWIGADGIRSITRGVLGNTAKPEFTGQVAWRAVIDAQDEPPEARIWMAPHRHVVTYPLGHNRLNIVAVQERTQWAAEGWNHPDLAANLRDAFADTCAPLRDILARVEDTQIWGLFRHPVADLWHNRTGAILGDAAHPTLPFLAQGANLAIEDAWVLAACYDAAPLSGALPRYQALRAARVSRAIAAANSNARNYHLSGIARRVAFTGLKTLGFVAPNAFLNRMGWLYGHDVTKADYASSSTQTGT